jgi:hypothetical protein
MEIYTTKNCSPEPECLSKILHYGPSLRYWTKVILQYFFLDSQSFCCLAHFSSTNNGHINLHQTRRYKCYLCKQKKITFIATFCLLFVNFMMYQLLGLCSSKQNSVYKKTANEEVERCGEELWLLVRCHLRICLCVTYKVMLQRKENLNMNTMKQ